MRALRWPTLALVALLASGCLAGNDPVADRDVVPPPGQVAQDGVLHGWEGACPCGPVVLRLAEDLNETEWLEVRVRWDGSAVADLALSVLGPDGSLHASVRGFDARRVQVWNAKAGDYTVLVNGTGAFEADAMAKSRWETKDGERLPNLTTTVPVDIHVGACDQVERLEQGATRCLRLGNGVANPGRGPLQVYLTYPEGAMSLGGLGHFVQQILQREGDWREKEVSGASYHPTHAHWHYDGLAQFSLYAVDEATGLRGDAVADHRKAGFCFLDWDVMVEQETVEAAGGYAESDCFIPFEDGWSNGVSAGWYDFYESGLTDQYVDIAGVADGLYEYVSVADPVHSLDESDLTDNAASVLIRLKGDAVTVVEERGWYHVQDEDIP